MKAKRFRLAGRKSNETSSKTEDDLEDEFEISDSQSLPSSQESIGPNLKDQISIDEEEDESEYESAEEK